MESWVVEWLSTERLRRYVIAAGHDDSRALRLYEWNATVNAALLHDFAHFEVGVRNLYDRGLMLSLQPGENHWLDDIPLQRHFPGRTEATSEPGATCKKPEFELGAPVPLLEPSWPNCRSGSGRH